jgi:hypothetical protein
LVLRKRQVDGMKQRYAENALMSVQQSFRASVKRASVTVYLALCIASWSKASSSLCSWYK